MATLRKRYVDTDVSGGAGDGSSWANAYASLSAAENAEDNTGNLVATDEYMEFDCRGVTLADVAAAVVGWTTDATRYIDIYTEAANGPAGQWSEAKYRIVGSGANLLTITEDYVHVKGIQVQLTFADSGTAYDAVRCTGAAGASNILCESCIAKGVLSGTNTAIASGFDANGGTVTFRNCLAYDFINGSETHRGFKMAAGTLQNCTAHNCNFAFYRSSGTPVATNCGAASCTSGFSATITQTTCSTSSPTFVDEGGDDFHLASGDTTWKDQGTDVSGTYLTDIDGATTTRNDIGMDEYVAAGGLSIPVARPYTQAVNRAAVY